MLDMKFRCSGWGSILGVYSFRSPLYDNPRHDYPLVEIVDLLHNWLRSVLGRCLHSPPYTAASAVDRGIQYRIFYGRYVHRNAPQSLLTLDSTVYSVPAHLYSLGSRT